MSLYDQVKQAQNPYMSQFVGSIAPELNAYSGIMQKRYDEAASSDDALGEALGNLQHLQLDEDTQYANELKNEYYQRLQSRAESGDFENMGRRTRQDAIRFSQAYMPLIQRQRDFAEVVKKVEADPSIADPQKKAQILQYIQHLNTSPRTETGDYMRGADGRVQLSAIQDWSYAKDVDINKKLADLLSKKETDIRQSGYSSDGQGLKISSIQELRSPQMMARLAKEMMETDPEIRAMLDRDVTLQTYAYTPEQVRAALKSSDLSPYQLLKKRGLNDKEIATLAKKNGMDRSSLNTSVIARQKAQLMDQGYSEEAAEKAILNNQVKQQMIEPHANLIGNLLAVDKRKLDAREDGLFLLRAKHAMDEADNGASMILSTPVEHVSELDPGKLSTDYVAKSRELKAVQSNVNAAVMVGLQKAGLTNDDPRHDLALANEYANDRTKLNQLRDKLVGTDRNLAERLELTQSSYLRAKDAVEYGAATVKSMEENAGISWGEMYKKYKEGNSKPLPLNEFINTVRDHGSQARGFISNAKAFIGQNTGGEFFSSDRKLNDVAATYDEKMKKGAAAVNGGKARLDTYNSIEPLSPGYIKNATALIDDRTKMGAIRLQELGSTDSKEGTLIDLLGFSKKDAADVKTDDGLALKNMDVRLNTRWNGGKPTITVRQPDGSSRVFQVTNPEALPMFKEIQHRVLNQAMSNKTSEQARSQAQDILLGLGESTMITSAHDLAGYAPSVTKYPLNETYSVKVKAGGPFGKTYEVYTRDGNNLVKKFNTPEDIAIQLGYDENRRIGAAQR